MSEDNVARALSGFLGFLSQRGISEDRAAEANRERDDLLARLARHGIGQSFYGSKLYSGGLSPGCQCCGAGTWSCAYLTRQCTADCFFCPSDADGESPLPGSGGLYFPGLEAYRSFLELMAIQGVSFSGGEPLLSYEEMLTWIPAVKQNGQNGRYVWMYTNGDLLDEGMLIALRAAGLNEIRINIAARDYDLDPVIMARKHIETVTVEIPTIPEDFEELKERFVDLQRLGVDHVNLHQLFANRVNYGKLAERAYTFLPPVRASAPVLESELAVLRLLLFTLENGIKLPINYCSTVYRTRCDDLARRRRAAALTVNGRETITEAGFVRRLAINGPAERIDEIDRSLASAEPAADLWQVTDNGRRLEIHAALLNHPVVAGEIIEASYYEAQIVAPESGVASLYRPARMLVVDDGLALMVGERLITTPVALSAAEMAARLDASLGGSGRHTSSPGPAPGLAPERMAWGLQQIRRCDTILEFAES